MQNDVGFSGPVFDRFANTLAFISIFRTQCLAEDSCPVAGFLGLLVSKYCCEFMYRFNKTIPIQKCLILLSTM